MENWITGVGWSVSLEIQTVWDTRFLAVQAARTQFYSIFAPGIIGEMGLHPTKLEKMARSAVIQKTKLPSYSNSVFFPSNNEKRMINAQRNLLKREQSKPEHKAPKHHVEVGMIDLHLNTANYIPVNRGSQNAPPQRIPQGVRRGVGEG